MENQISSWSDWVNPASLSLHDLMTFQATARTMTQLWVKVLPEKAMKKKKFSPQRVSAEEMCRGENNIANMSNGINFPPTLLEVVLASDEREEN